MQRVDIAVEAAKVGGAVLRSVRQTDLKIEEKGTSRTDIVTAADVRSQTEIISVIRRAFPNDLIVGEEGTDGDDRSTSIWYVDPLDGTTNYAHGLPFYCVSIAYCDSDGIGIGVIYDPSRDDLFVGVRNEGAALNGQKIAVSECRQLRSSLVSTQVQSSDGEVLDRHTKHLRALLGVARAVRSLGAPALALAYVACGRLDAFFEGSMSPWDTLAGTLLVQESGGRVTTFDGASRPTDGKSDILATNEHLHDDMLRRLMGDRGGQ